MRYFSILLISLIVCGSASAKLRFFAVPYKILPAWQANNFKQSFSAFKKSCKALTRKKFKGELSSSSISIGKHWRSTCKEALTARNVSNAAARRFFEKHFIAYHVSNGDVRKGLLTGYYLPEINGSLHYASAYHTPIYARPKDLVSVRLGWFSKQWKNEKISGRLINGRLYPYGLSRRAINDGAIKYTAKKIAYVNNRTDRFFLQIQGSGFIKLPNGKRLLLGYNGENGFPYYSIGKWFVKNNIFTLETVSMQNIRKWLYAHPRRASRVMELNPSFTFFKVLKGNTVYGTDHIPLTAGYSLAVDSHMIPLGLPIYIVNPKLKRLFISQDTGGAIKGVLRGDVYWGAGKKAEHIAGHMRSQASFYLLLPKK